MLMPVFIQFSCLPSVHLELVAFTACKIPQKSLLEKYNGKSQKAVWTDRQKEESCLPLPLKKSPGTAVLWKEAGHLSGGWGSFIAGTEIATIF